jgi:hypothetical protein
VTAKELVRRSLQGEKTERVPAGLHGWGLYKFAYAGIISDYFEQDKAWSMHGQELADVEMRFQDRFRPDYLHLAEAFFESKKKIINDPLHQGLREAVRRLESRRLIDEFLDLVYENAVVLGSQKKFDHLRLLVDRYGEEIFIFLETEGPVHDMLDEDGVLGFNTGMLLMADNPAGLAYLMEGMYSRQLMYVQAVREHGAHGYAHSVSYFGADLVSPDTYRNLLFPLERDFYREVRRLGLVPIMNFWGNVTPVAEQVRNTEAQGLLIDESRKGYVLDVGEIKQILGERMALFGNVSSETTLLHGSVEEVRREVSSQIKRAGGRGGFLSCSGPPICFGTPEQNVEALIQTARDYRWDR